MKANKRALEESNFWDLRWVHGKLAGKPIVDADETKARHQKKKDRLQNERETIHNWRAVKCPAYRHRNKRQTKHNQIEYGFNIANWMMEQHA